MLELFGGTFDVPVIVEDVFAFEGELESVGDAGHVVVAAGMEHDDESFPVTESVTEPVKISRSNRAGRFGEFAGESEGDLFAFRETRPVIGGEDSAALSDFFVRESGDFPIHFAVAHAVGATNGAGGDPEEALSEDAVVVGGGFGTCGAHEDFIGGGEFGGVAEDDAIPDDIAGSAEEAGLEIFSDDRPVGNGESGLALSLIFEADLEVVVRDGRPVGVIGNEILSRRFGEGLFCRRRCRRWRSCGD